MNRWSRGLDFGVLALGLCGAGDLEAGRVARCEILVTNNTPFRVQVYVDGVYWGWVSQSKAFTFTGIVAGPTVVYGTTEHSEYSWGPEALQCRGTATWKLSF